MLYLLEVGLFVEEVFLINVLQLLYKIKTQKAFYHMPGKDLKVKIYQVLKVGIMEHRFI
ncbi:hypothetical protein KIS1582_1222 [Cytobacillus firmus]|uniref:Uncharacterized protein n=1 Tax=Cytobacillus firmus TaxID=1399 RepID=A0A800NBF1_CYTFI|nr:hypothetical protein KIS1582_1222 [Cytobacillus firmus]